MADPAARDPEQLGVSDVDMSQGSLRCDANVSVRPVGSTELGTKTELKNMNSFAFLERGVRAEIDRQIGLLEAGEEVVQETLHFDPATGRLTPLRSKEEAHDYRYFPEPDLVPLLATEEMLAAARAELPELPAARAERFERELGLSAERAHELAFRAELGDYFERAVDAAAATAMATAPRRPRSRTGSRSWSSGSAPTPTRPTARWHPEAWPRSRRWSPPRRSAAMPPGTCSPGSSRRGRPARDRRARGAGRDRRTRRASPRSSIGRSPPIRTRPSRSGRATSKAIGPLVGFVMRETKGRADGGEVTRLIRERLEQP